MSRQISINLVGTSTLHHPEVSNMASAQSNRVLMNDFIFIEEIECSPLFRRLSDQLRHVFIVQSKIKEEMLHNILGEAFMNQVHVHNGTLLECFGIPSFTPLDIETWE